MSARRKAKSRPTSRAVISTQLRAILTSGEHTLFAVARDSGVPLSSLSRFVSGERDLYLGSLDRIADVLGLKLIEGGRVKVRESKSPRPGSARRADRPEPVAAAMVDADEPPRTGADTDAHTR